MEEEEGLERGQEVLWTSNDAEDEKREVRRRSEETYKKRIIWQMRTVMRRKEKRN